MVCFHGRVSVGLQQNDIDVFYRLSVLSAQLVIGVEKYPDADVGCHYPIEKIAQAYKEILSCIRTLSKFNNYLSTSSDTI